MSTLAEEIRQAPCDQSLYGDNAAALSIATGPPTSWRTRHLRLRSTALREKVDSGALHVYHLRGEWMPADALTKALPSAKFASMLELLNVGALQAQARIASLSWTRSVLAVMIASPSLLLKGQDRGEAVPPGAHALEAADPYFWIWVVGFVGVIILAWEGAKALFRSRCQSAKGVTSRFRRLPGVQESKNSRAQVQAMVLRWSLPQSLLIRGLREGCVG